MRRLITALLLACAGPAICTTAAPTGVDLQGYRTATQAAVTACKRAVARAMGTVDPQDDTSDFEGCISKRKSEARSQLTDLLRGIKKPGAQEALKAYHVVFVGALEAVRPEESERKSSYDQRQGLLNTRLVEAWTRVELEA